MVELPTALLGLVRMFNNYSLLLEVFGPNCPHLIHVLALRDGLEDNKNDLEMRITKTLCLQLLWRVHRMPVNSFEHVNDGNLVNLSPGPCWKWWFDAWSMTAALT
jgi:hypothetical protein